MKESYIEEIRLIGAPTLLSEAEGETLQGRYQDRNTEG
jgi:hypothetical protein